MSELTSSYRQYNDLPYVVLDLETSVKNRGENAVGNMAASPYHPYNKMVLKGYIDSVAYPIKLLIVPGYSMVKPAKYFATEMIFVGHNIKFDFLYILKQYKDDPDFIKWFLQDIKLWDTMVVEYLISAQQEKFASLDKLALKYGGTLKDSKIKKYWEDGVDTEDIPEAELREYLEEDLKNTEKVFLEQRKICNTMDNIYNIINLEMESLKDTILTEWNGMYVNIDILHENAAKLNTVLKELEGTLKDFNGDLNWASPAQLQAFLFGGKVKLGYKYEPTGEVYNTGIKKGHPKVKKVVWEEEYKGYLESDNDGTTGTFLKGFHFGTSTDEETLNRYYEFIDKLGIVYSANWSAQLQLLRTILAYRKYNKDFNTYYVGIAKLVWPNDSLVHATFNHTATDTGRLSCSNPNLQNITSSE